LQKFGAVVNDVSRMLHAAHKISDRSLLQGAVENPDPIEGKFGVEGNGTSRGHKNHVTHGG
jgi:hypothetical protein